MEAYVKPPSLWHLVEEIVQPNEHAEIREMLGVSLVEQSLELHQEISTLIEIWRQIRDERTEILTSPRFLPEPPNQRDHLVKEICFFVESVKEKATQKGVNPELILRKHNNDVLNYAVETARPESAMSHVSQTSDGRETPMMPLAKDRYQASDMKDELKVVNKQLNYLDFDQVCESLRSTLIKEINQLIEDAQFLQNCIDNEVELRDCTTPGLRSREPTLTELREERSLLEKELLAVGSLTATPVVTKPNFIIDKKLPYTPPSSSDSSPPLLPNYYDTHIPGLDGFSDDSPSFSSRPGPVKASHKIVLSATSPSKPTSFKLKATEDRVVSPKTNLLINRLADIPNKPLIMRSNKLTQAKSSQSDSNLKPNDLKLSPNDQSLTQASVKQEGSKGDGRPKRRSVSTGRLRVVDVSNIVEVHNGKGDSAAECFTFSSGTSSISSSPFSPTPPPYTLNTDSMPRPGSAHANRFRKMVMGCRDGE
uniref:Coiled-coil domain-containing protein 24 n=1 Tax=Biomphalaria glabrata TaxID=6526 RepID=A0A2C9KX05_BIOGL